MSAIPTEAWAAAEAVYVAKGLKAAHLEILGRGFDKSRDAVQKHMARRLLVPGVEIAEAGEVPVQDTDQIVDLRRALTHVQKQLAKAKERTDDLVTATIEAAREATLSTGPIPAVIPPARDKRKSPEAALWHMTDWQGAKALADDTPILTTKGWKNHGDIRPGDMVYGPDGLPKTVTAVTGSSVVECMEVQFDGGVTIIASNDHLWQGWRRYKNGDGPYRGYERRSLLWTTAQIAGLRPTKRDTRTYVERAFHVDLPLPIELPTARMMLVDPYVLGAWLGDGSVGKGELGLGEDDAREMFPDEPIGKYNSTIDSDCVWVRPKGLAAGLRELGIFEKKSIPTEYLLESRRHERVALLQGLMDTDGTINSKGTCSFTNTNLNLIEGVEFLLASLGIKSSRTAGVGRINGIDKRTYWEVCFTPNFRAFRLLRKHSRQKKDVGEQSRYRFVQQVLPAGLRSAQCLTVDGGLYLAGRDLVVTHNCTTSYNSEVMRERVMRFCEKAARITEIQRADHPVSHCVIAFGGDMVEGLFNFPTQAFEIDSTIFAQYVNVSRLEVDVVRYALSIYETVEVVAEWGNHGRIGSKRDAVPRSDNFDRMTYELSRQLLSGEKRLKWEDCPEDIQRIEIGNYRALLCHGDEVGRNGFASPSTIVQHVNRWRSGAYPWPFRDVYVGHYHTHNEWAIANGEGAVYQTGSTESDNRYAGVMLAASAIPTQRLSFIDPERGRVTAQYKIWLDS